VKEGHSQALGATRCSLGYVLSNGTHRNVQVVEQCFVAARFSVSAGGPCFKIKRYHPVPCRA